MKNESLPSIVVIIYIDIDRNDIDVNATEERRSMATLLRIKFRSGRWPRRENTMKVLVTGATARWAAS
jgi:hypothetical protein